MEVSSINVPCDGDIVRHRRKHFLEPCLMVHSPKMNFHISTVTIHEEITNKYRLSTSITRFSLHPARINIFHINGSSVAQIVRHIFRRLHMFNQKFTINSDSMTCEDIDAYIKEVSNSNHNAFTPKHKSPSEIVVYGTESVISILDSELGTFFREQNLTYITTQSDSGYGWMYYCIRPIQPYPESDCEEVSKEK